jgi:hypothetical protein
MRMFQPTAPHQCHRSCRRSQCSARSRIPLLLLGPNSTFRQTSNFLQNGFRKNVSLLKKQQPLPRGAGPPQASPRTQIISLQRWNQAPRAPPLKRGKPEVESSASRSSPSLPPEIAPQRWKQIFFKSPPPPRGGIKRFALLPWDEATRGGIKRFALLPGFLTLIQI